MRPWIRSGTFVRDAHQIQLQRCRTLHCQATRASPLCERVFRRRGARISLPSAAD